MLDSGIDFTALRGPSLPRAALRLLLALAGAIGVAAPTVAGCVEDLPECGDGVEPDQLKCPVEAEEDASLPPSCVPGSGNPVADCGVFVSAGDGDDSAAGSPSEPVKTLKKALDLAGVRGKP